VTVNKKGRSVNDADQVKFCTSFYHWFTLTLNLLWFLWLVCPALVLAN
jgi:hypothetical protein